MTIVFSNQIPKRNQMHFAEICMLKSSYRSKKHSTTSFFAFFVKILLTVAKSDDIIQN